MSEPVKSVGEDERDNKIWLQGFDSAVKVCQEAIQALLAEAREVPGVDGYILDNAAFHRHLKKISRGMYRDMPLSNRTGLDYYFAAQSQRNRNHYQGRGDL